MMSCWLRSALVIAGTLVACSLHAAVGRTPGSFGVGAEGAANYSIPLWTPPGVNGIGANLALHYNSNRGNGLLGVGWSVGPLSAITRCAKTWAQDGTPAPVSLQTSDGYCLDGQRLRLREDSPAGYGLANSTYRTELETFADVKAVGTAGNGPQSFTVRTKDGLTYQYGYTADSRIEAGGGASSTVAIWAVNKIADRNGNSVQFTYEEDTVNGTYRIDRIDYPYTPLGSPYYQVDFVYQAADRTDVLSGYRAGYAWREPKRLERIDIKSGATVVRRYDLSWESGTASSRSRIKEIQECVGADCLQATTVNYHNGTAGWDSSPTAGQTVATLSTAMPIDMNGDGRDDLVYANPSTNLYSVMIADGSSAGYAAATSTTASAINSNAALPIDFNSDGKTDLLIPNASGNWRALVSNGTTFSVNDTVGAGSSTVAATGAGGNAWIADYDGDGRDDLLYVVNPGTTSSALKGRRMTASGLSSTVDALLTPGSSFIFDYLSFDPVQNQYRSDLRLADFNGDGRADVLALTSYWESCGGCPGEDGWWIGGYSVLLSSGTASAPTMTVSQSFTIDEGFWGPALADVNGDGLTDVVHLDSTYPVNGNWAVSFGSGTGVSSTVSTSAPVGDANKAKFVDWDGDGKTDVITSVGGTYHYSRSTGNGFETAVSLGIPDSTAVAHVKFADVDGNGLSDWVYGNAANQVIVRRHLGDRPDLASSFSDGFGIAQTPHYVPISQGSYTKRSDAVFPYQDFQGALYIVDSVTASTGNGGTYTQTYSYEGAQMHRQGRGFMGFYLQKMQDSRDSLYRRDVRRQDFPYAGMIKETELRQSDDTTVIQKTVNTAQKHDYGGTNQSAYFPYVSTAITDANEFGGSQNGQAVARQTVTSVVDSYGNATTITVARQDMDSGSPWSGETFTLQTVNTISNDTSNWCLGLPTQTTVTSTLPDSTSDVRTTSAVIDYVKCRADNQTREPASSTLKVVASYAYDDCGNIYNETLVGKKPDGTDMASRSVTRDFGARCQFPETVTNPLSQSSTIAYLYDLGLQQTVTDPNGLVSQQTFDAFGRSDVITRPDGTDTNIDLIACNANNAYCNTGASDVRWQQQAVQRDTSDTPIRTELIAYDGLDRPRYRSTEIFGGVWSTVVRTYDASGRPARDYVPTSGALSGYRSLSYDALGRVTTDALYTSSSASSPDRQSTVAYAGRKVTVTDPLAHATDRYTDVRGKLRRVVEPSPDGSSTRGTTHYAYDVFGNLKSVTDAGGAVTQWSYNRNGQLTSLNHPDRGNWSYTPNSLGEMVSQTDAKAQTTTLTYDQLSRPLTRVEAEGTTTWTWGTSAAAHEIGQLNTVSGPGGYSEAYAYDGVGRLAQTTVVADTTYYINMDYNAAGLPESMTYPTSTAGYALRIKYDYDHGVLSKVSDYNQSSTVFWELNATDARGNALDESLGTASPAIGVISGFDPLTGLIDYRTAGTDSGYINRQNLSFEWDDNGNLKKRIDGNQSITEEFFYDGLNRLDYSTRNGVTNFDINYSLNGNVTYRSDYYQGGSFNYSTKPHAVTSVSGSDGCLSWQEDFGYDANGNQTSRYAVGGTGSTVSWYSYNLPNTINLGGSASQFFYTPNRARWKQVANYGGATETTIYVGGILEKLTRGSVTEYRHRIPAGSSSTAVYVRRSSGSGSSSTYYTTSDHLGSSTVTMDSNGASLVNLSFGAYGKRRGAAWNDVPSSTDWDQITATGRDGFTGHEHLDNVGAIHMNGRVYDPQLGRFMSADPLYVGDLANPQSLNPYGYVRNRPLSATDPSGFSEDGLPTQCRWNFICHKDLADYLLMQFNAQPPIPEFGEGGGAADNGEDAPAGGDDEDSEGESEDFEEPQSPASDQKPPEFKPTPRQQCLNDRYGVFGDIAADLSYLSPAALGQEFLFGEVEEALDDVGTRRANQLLNSPQYYAGKRMRNFVGVLKFTGKASGVVGAFATGFQLGMEAQCRWLEN
jgi:RHS repeat-associated protein